MEYVFLYLVFLIVSSLILIIIGLASWKKEDGEKNYGSKIAIITGTLAVLLGIYGGINLYSSSKEKTKVLNAFLQDNQCKIIKINVGENYNKISYKCNDEIEIVKTLNDSEFKKFLSP